MKITFSLSTDVTPTTAHRWLALDGAELLKEIDKAIANGDEIVIKLAVKKEVKVIQVSAPPPMLKMWGPDTTNGN